MIDQSHNLKDKLEAMVQSVVTAQELCAGSRLSIASDYAWRIAAKRAGRNRDAVPGNA